MNTTHDDPRWARIVARDPDADGQVWYSVATTGVYCRPSCPSRTANPKNVRLHATLEEARATGLRPCRRCDPEGPSPAARTALRVAAACRSIADAETPPTLAILASQAGLSPGHFHRQFRRATGLTPKAYADFHRADRVRTALQEGGTVTEALYAAGFQSSGRFYARSADMLGMRPARFGRAGAEETIRFAVGQSSLGAVLVASSARGVVAVSIGDDPGRLVRTLQDRFARAELVGGDAEYEALVARVVGLIEAPGGRTRAAAPELPLDVRGTLFQQRVWRALRDIPAGGTATYAQVAASVGAPGSARAVAGACAANRIAVAIPCHRVVRTDGDLSGYRWGVERKRALLDREAGRGPGASRSTS